MQINFTAEHVGCKFQISKYNYLCLMSLKDIHSSLDPCCRCYLFDCTVQSCLDIDIMKIVTKHTQSAISLLNANSGTAQDKEVFEPATKFPNSNHIQ